MNMKKLTLPLAFIGLMAMGVSSQADVLYGIERGTCNVIKLEMNTDGSGLVQSNLGSVIADYDPSLYSADPLAWQYNYPNGVGYELATNRLYFTIPQDPTNKGGASELWYFDLGTALTTYVGDLEANASNGTVYNGIFYYFAHLTDNLHTYDLGSGNESSVAGVSNGATPVLELGDIDIDDTGKLFGTAGDGAGQPYVYFTIDDLSDPAGSFTEVATGEINTIQSALGCNGDLWVNRTISGEFFILDKSDGTLTIDSATPVFLGPQFNDLAAGFCEPEDTTVRIPLCAGQHTEMGAIIVSYDGSDLCVTYETYGDWYMVQTHLSVQQDPADFPQTGSGNPKVGHFEYGDDWLDFSQMEEYCISVEDLMEKFGLEEGDPLFPLYIAAHTAVVRVVDGEVVQGETAWPCDGEGFPGRNWATYFMIDLE